MNSNSDNLISKYRGCLFGLAIGDALGAPVEFLSIQEIQKCYGKKGIDDFYTWDNFKPGSYTDDTQMSLATAVGCIRSYHRMKEVGVSHPASVVYKRYLEWLRSMKNPYLKRMRSIC